MALINLLRLENMRMLMIEIEDDSKEETDNFTEGMKDEDNDSVDE